MNNNYDNDHPDDEPNIVQMSSYYDVDSLNNLFRDKRNSFCILSLNCQSINAKCDQLNIKVQQLKGNGHEFSAICLQETWLSRDSDTSLFKIDGYNLISQGKMCSSHRGLAIYVSEKFNFSNIDFNINSQIWEGQFIEIANIESNKSLILGNVYRPPNNTNNLYESFTNEFIPILENLQRANRETVIAGDFNIDLLKMNNNATLGNYFNSVVAQSFFPQITLPTRFSDHNYTLIDNFLCKLKRSYLPSTSGILVSRISDHLPYFTFLNFLTSQRKYPTRSIKIQTWNAESIHHFQTELNSANIYELLDTTLTADPTINLNILNDMISKAKNKHLPYRTVKFNKHKHKHKNSNWITKGIVRSIKYRDKLYLQLKRTPVDSERHNILKLNLKTYQSILKRLIRDAKKQYYQKQFEKYKNDVNQTNSKSHP